MKKYICLLIVLSGLSLQALQARSCHSPEGAAAIGYKIGYTYQSSSFVEGGVFLYKTLPFVMGSGPAGFKAINLGCAARVGGSSFLLAPKLSVEIYALAFGARLNLEYLTDFKQGGFQLSPEAGFTFAGLAYVMGGYNFTLSNKEFWNATGPRLSIGVNLYELDKFF